MATLDDKTTTLVKNYELETKIETEDKKRGVSILNKIRYYLLDYYIDSNIDRILGKYKKKHFNQWNYGSSWNLRKSTSEETIGERVKIVPQRRQKRVTIIKILNLYKLIIRTNKRWKSFR